MARVGCIGDGEARMTVSAAPVLTTLLLTSLLGIVAIVVDLGALRGDVRADQSVADFAAAAGQGLAANDPTAACKAAVAYINMNASSRPRPIPRRSARAWEPRFARAARARLRRAHPSTRSRSASTIRCPMPRSPTGT